MAFPNEFEGLATRQGSRNAGACPLYSDVNSHS